MMDFVFDYISVNAFWTIVLIVHALLAVATLGALTHQAMSVAMPARQAAGPAGFVTRFRGVYGAGYATAICVLWVATFVLGAWIYTKYRIAVRIPLERTGYWKTLGAHCGARVGPSSGLLVFLEEPKEPGLRQRAQGGHPSPCRDVLVRLPRGACSQQCAGVWMTSVVEPGAATRDRKISSLATSPAFGTFAIVFAIAAPVIYVASEIANLPLFTYHPGTGRLEFGWAAPRANEGPAMYWYGWIATMLIGSTLLGAVAARFPNLGERIPLFLVWLLPLLALPILAYVLMPFWAR